MIKFLKKQRAASSVLGLAFDGNRLEAVVLRRGVSGLQIKESLAAPLALSPLGGDPELVGREIRNHLDKAGVRERRCVVAIPVGWVLTFQTAIPDLPEADIESFLQLEAERGFPSGFESLFITNSRTKAPNGEQFATLIAIPRHHLDNLEQALRAAQLKPISFALGIASLSGNTRDNSPGALTLLVGGSTLGLEASLGGGIVALRSLDGAIDTGSPQQHIDADLVAREIRITLGQLPPAIGEAMRSVRVFARGEHARQFLNDISPRLQAMGLKVEPMDRATAAELTTLPPGEIALSPALAVAANAVRGVVAGPELLPPKISPLQLWLSSNVATRKLGWAGAVAVGVIVIVAGLFIAQQVQIQIWQSKWQAMKPDVDKITATRKQITAYRPWFDDTYTGLRILRDVVQAFPDDGSVTAKRLQIKDLSQVDCAAVARDNQSYLVLQRKLATTPGVTNVITPSIQVVNGSQVEFSIKLEWQGANTQ